jgi:ribosome-binding factor A
MSTRSSRRPGRRSFDRSVPVSDPRGEQLAAQAHDALQLALASLEDPRLDDVVLRAVTSDLGGALVATFEAPTASLHAAELALALATPRLRHEVASEIHRKRAPNLRVLVIPSDLEARK